MSQDTIFCQSCAMPLVEGEHFGTEADGTKSTEYCKYCYENGAFVGDMTMEEMIDFCVPMVSKGNPYPDEETAKKEMLGFFPQLKRWKK